MKKNKLLWIREGKMFHYLLSVFLFILTWQHYEEHNAIVFPIRYHIFVYGLFALVLLFLSRTYNAYSIEYSSAADCGFSLTLASTIAIFGVYVLTLIAWKKLYGAGPFLRLFLIQTGWNFLWALLESIAYGNAQPPIPTALIYKTKKDIRRLDGIRGFWRRYRVDALVENPQSAEEAISRMGDCRAIFLADVDQEIRYGVMMYCAEQGIRVFLLPNLSDMIMMGGTHMQTFSVPMVRVWKDIHPEFMLIKRITDILLSGIAVIITGPIMLVTAFFIHREDNGPVFYKQTRLTKNGKTFEILKFRSMRVDAEADGVARLSSGENDSRITKVGHFIRKTRIDELPQLLNVLKGDMSIVGPRPERPEIARQYERVIPEFRLRLQAKAGLTGYAQVYGKYNSNPFEKLQMDLLYINKMTPLLDLELMFATVRVLFMKESTAGVAQGSETAMKSNNRPPRKFVIPDIRRPEDEASPAGDVLSAADARKAAEEEAKPAEEGPKAPKKEETYITLEELSRMIQRENQVAEEGTAPEENPAPKADQMPEKDFSEMSLAEIEETVDSVLDEDSGDFYRR